MCTTLIESISKCVRDAKEIKESEDYIKLNERIAYIEINNGIKPATEVADKNQNNATGGGASQRPSEAKKAVQEKSGGGTTGTNQSSAAVSMGGGNSTLKSAAKSVDGKEQQKS
uniref:Uncharacterized protein n=1 Tax=Panagrolaimus sp. ES5 TaxID=591445 RepID=A0AC34FZ62_9BILA